MQTRDDDPSAVLAWSWPSGWRLRLPESDARHGVLDLWLPICNAHPDRPVAVGHLGQSIDGFIDTELKKNGLALSPKADKRTLIRRATFDLVGLPPTAEEVEAFEKDKSPDAFAKVVDRLIGFRISKDAEVEGIDFVEHAETAYELDTRTGSGSFLAGHGQGK